MKGVNICVVAISGILAYCTSIWPQAAPPDRQTSSATYSETVKRLKDWSEHCCVEADDVRFGWLFADGNLNIRDLVDACADKDEATREKAAELLQVLGRRESENCGAESHDYLVGWATTLTDADFIRFEKALCSRSCEKAKLCKAEQLPDVSDSFVYALILDGSDRAQALLRRVYALRTIGM